MANNSGRIIDRYKSYITKSQRDKLKGMYKGYKQTMADERRDAYLDNRRSMNRVSDTASAMGLGQGYIDRKQARVDIDMDRYGRQLDAQADSAFEKQVVNAANQTIDARNKAAQEKYKRELAAAKKKQAEAQAAYERYLAQLAARKAAVAKGRKDREKREGDIRASLQQMQRKKFLQQGGTASYHPNYMYEEPYQPKRPRSTPKRNPLAPVYRKAFQNKGISNYGKQNMEYNESGSSASTTVGTKYKPVFSVDSNVKLPVRPKDQERLKVEVNDFKSKTPQEQEQLKANARAEHANKAAEYQRDLNRLQTLVNKSREELINTRKEFARYEAIALDEGNTPEIRINSTKEMNKLAKAYETEYAKYASDQKKARALDNELNAKFDEFQYSRAKLAAMGVDYDNNSLATDIGWLNQGKPLSGLEPEKTKIAVQSLDKNSDTYKALKPHLDAVTRSVGTGSGGRGGVSGYYHIPKEEIKWFEENGYGELVSNPELRKIKLNSAGLPMSFEDLVMEYFQGVKQNNYEYERYRNTNATLTDMRNLSSNERNALIAQGDAATGLSELTKWDGSIKNMPKVGKLAKVLGLKAGFQGSSYLTMPVMNALATDTAAQAYLNYCVAIGDKAAAKDFLYDYAELANALSAKDYAEKISAQKVWAPIKWVEETMMQLASGVSQGELISSAYKFFSNEALPMGQGEYYPSYIQENQIGRGNNEGMVRSVGSAAVSVGQQLPGLAAGSVIGGLGATLGTGIGGTAGSLIAKGAGKFAVGSMFITSGAHAKQEALRQGYGDRAATAYAVVNGLSEAGLQDLMGGIAAYGTRGWLTKMLKNLPDQIAKNNAFGRVIIKQLLDVASEITEEETQNILDPLFKNLTLGEHNKVGTTWQEAGETALSTLFSTLLLNSFGLRGEFKSEKNRNLIADAAGMSVKDAQFLMDTQERIQNGEAVSNKDKARFAELTAVLEKSMPDNVIKAISDGKMTAVDWLTSSEGITSGKLTNKLTEADIKTEAAKNPVTGAEIKAVDHTEALKGKTDEQRRDYLLNAAPTGKVGNAYYTTADGKAIQFRNLNTTQKANYVLAQKCAKAFEGSVDIVIHDTLPVSNGAMVGSDGKLHIALDTTNEQGRESIAYWTLAHEAGHALKIADSKAWNEMFGILTDYAKDYKDRDGKILYDALVDSITNQYKYDSNSDAFNDEMFSLIAERMVGSEGEQWAATLGDNTIFDAIAADRNVSAKAKKGFLGKLKTSVEKLSRQFRDGGFSKERKRLAKIREQLTEAYKRINEGDSVREKYAEQRESYRAKNKGENVPETEMASNMSEDGKVIGGDAMKEKYGDDLNATRFQMKTPVEETDRLIAWHNMSEDALRSALELGGLAMPSWAIKTADKAHTSYGDISVIAPRALVDPKQNRNSMIFGGDAWTPVFPNVDYKISRDAVDALESEIIGLVGENLYREIGGAALDTENIADQFRRSEGAVSGHYKTNLLLRYAYLKSIGEKVEVPRKEEELDYGGRLKNGAVERFAHNLVNGRTSLRQYLEMPYEELMEQEDLLNAISSAILSDYEDTLPARVYEALKKKYETTKIPFNVVDNMLQAADRYFEHGIRQTVDRNALSEKVDEAIDESAYKKWIGDKLNATIERKGIRNNKDMFTPSGNRRSFDALHYEYNLANIVKAMKSQPKQGRTQFLSGPGSVKGAALKSYNTVEQVRADRGRLVNTAEEAEAAYNAYSKNLESILDRMGKDRFSSADALIEVLQHAKTEDGIYRYMERELKGWYNVSKDIAHDIYELIGQINALPMEYFEGKTYDAVTFDETAAVVVPDTTSEELKQQLADAGANVVEYKAGDNEDRLEKVNSVEGIRFQNRATDTEYLSLAKKYRDGTASAEDINALNKAVEEAAKKAGYTIKAYHGRGSNFTVFDKEKIGEMFPELSTLGFYFTPFSEDARGYASNWGKNGNVLSAYLRFENPLVISDEGWGSAAQQADLRRGDLKRWAEEGNHDGIIVNSVDEEDTVYIAFDASQIKSADPVTYDDNGDIIPLSERFNEENEDIRYQDRDFRIDFNVPQLDTKALHEAVKGGEGTVENRFEVKYEKTDAGFAVHITDKDSGKTYDRAETVTEGNAKTEAERAAAAVIRNIKRGKPDSKSKSTAGIYIEPGANAARSSAVPVSYEDENGNIRRNSKVARTMIEAGWMTDEQAERFADQVHDGIMSYEPVTNAEAKAYAEEKVSAHPAAAQAAWDAIYNSFVIPSDKDLAVGYQLMANAANDGDFDMMLKLGTELREMMTKAGQAIQSMNLLKQMGAVADVYRIDQAVQKMNDDLMKAAKGYFISVNPDLVEALLKTKPDTQEYDKALEALYKDIASQIRPSLSDALTEYRYLAMLGNPRTHIRNLVGNAVFMPAVAMKNIFGTIFEGVRYGGNSAMKTKALAYGKQYGQFAKEDWGKVKTTIKSTGNKYRDMMNDIDNYRNHFGKGLGWLDKLAKFNSKLLEGEDMLFKQAYYRTALAAELSAKKVNLNDLRAAVEARDSGAKMQKDSAEFKLLSLYEEARARAIKEANVNTYNDANKFARDLNAFSRGGGKLRHMMVEGLLPFKNTPANIVSRSIEYSPVGLINSVTREAVKLHKGEIGANEFVDKIARGFSGSAIFALGIWLAKAGVLVGPLGDDKEDKEKKRRGHQAFSIEIAGKSYTLDWMAPVCIPLFTGVALYEMLEKEGNGEHWSQYAMNAMTGMLEPITKMSMLEGIENLIDSLAYSDSKLEDAAITVGTSYLTQFIPTLSGQIARTIDPYTRRTYSDKESMLPRLVDKFVQTVQKKIPGWNQSLQPYVNELGEAEKEDRWWLRAIDNLISPGFRSAISNTKLDKELERLGDPSIYPSAASKSFTYNKATYNLHADEYTAFATARGTTAATLMNSLIDSKAYQGLTDLDQVKAQVKAIEYANAIAKAGILNMRGILDSDIDWDALGSWVPKANEYAKLSDSPTALADYISIKTYTDGMKADGSSRFGNVADYTVTNKDGTTTVKWNDMKYDYLQSLDLTDKERLFLADAFGIKQDAYQKAEAAVAEVPNLTIDAYTKALDHWQDLTVEKNQKKETLSEAEYEKWLAENTNAFKKYLNDTKELSGQQKFALLTKIGSSEGWEGKANDLRSNYGVGYDDAWRAAYKASTLTSTDEASKNAQYMSYLNTTKLGAKQKFGLYGAFGTSTSSLVEKATAFATGGKYNDGKNSAAAYGKPSYDALWNAYTAYNGGVQHEAFYDWLSKQSGMNAQQRFACCEFTNSASAWMERAAEVHSKMGIGYDTLWKIKVYWRNESGQGKKARITAYCKKLGLKQSQIDKLYNEYKFLS